LVILAPEKCKRFIPATMVKPRIIRGFRDCRSISGCLEASGFAGRRQ
jgi:hypothetical protein